MGIEDNVIICDVDLLKNFVKTCIIVTAGKAWYTDGMREPVVVCDALPNTFQYWGINDSERV